MEKIAWDDNLNIGVEVVDKAHAKLFRIMQKLAEMPEDTKVNQHTYREGIKYLETYSMKHFLEEEIYMRSIRYGGYVRHKQIHDNFRDKTLISLRKDLELSDYSPAAVERFIRVMMQWLKEHIMREDQAIVGKATVPKGVDLSSQIPVISRSVNRAAQESFQVETKLISSDYKGQNIGSGRYCYQCYDLENGIRVQLLLGVEDPLVLRGISRIQEQTGQEQEQGKVKRETILQVFEPLFQTISKLFRVETECGLTKDNLLTREGFRAEFMKGYPCSLLFSTKLGYIIFCYRGWRVKSSRAAQ